MSNTHLHKGKGYWNNGIQDENKPEIKKYLNHCNRYNRDFSYFKAIQLKLEEKQLNNDMMIQLEESRG